MYYRIERTYLTDAKGSSLREYDLRPYLISALDADAAIESFVREEGGTLSGVTSPLPGDKAMGSATREGRFYIVFAQRAAETVGAALPAAGERARPC